MSWFNKILPSLFVAFVFAAGVQADQGSLESLNRLYGEILEDYTQPSEIEGMPLTSVDYQSLKGDERWPLVVEKLAEISASELPTPDHQMAFYINAYNILAIDKVLSNWPLRSLRSVGSMINPVWLHDAGRVAGEPVTLNYLEHEVLREMGDPRVHMAINCASISCPDLRQEPYTAKNLDDQLNDQVERFLSQEGKGLVVDSEDRTVHLSAVFDWFEEDFEAVGGVDAFVQSYRPDLKGDWSYEADLGYNWGINSQLTAKMLRAMRDDF